MVSAHTPLTTLSRPCSRALYKVGVYGRSIYITFRVISYLIVFSCTAENNNLDSGGGPRANAHTNQLRATMDPRTLWDDYGIVADVEVHIIGILDIFVINGPIFSAIHSSFSSCGYT